jgi:hypothetical protein
MWFLSEGECELDGLCGDPNEMDANFTDRMATLSEDAVWWAIIRELPTSWLN